jgi:phosphopantothenoylcysteine decarboxylase/phosphopantothenate--cysteine ligase
MKVLLGVCGGIAAYKAAELTRELQRRGAEVQVVMTASAEKFVTPLTFASLSGRQVLTSVWNPTVNEAAFADAESFDIEHIRVAQEIDAFVIAPATANIIANLAHGIAYDLLSTIYLATTAPVLIAPAMNVNMLHHPATQQNLDTLRSRGVRIIEPSAGYLACGMVGDGRLADPKDIAETTVAAIRQLNASRNDLDGETVLITAGGTREPIDPVRYLGNRSSGKMGFALAEACLARGANVILVTAAPAPENLAGQQINVSTAAEMQQAVLTHLPKATILVMAAAVSDFRVAQPSQQKLKKHEGLTLEFVVNDDILASVIRHRQPGTLVIGFAAETQNLLEEGRRKLKQKGLDAIVANDVSHPDSGFCVDRNSGFLLTNHEEFELPPSSKREMADHILDCLQRIKSSPITTISN